MRIPRPILPAALLMGMVACATNPATGKKQISFIGESQEVSLGRDADRDIVASLGQYEDEALQAYVNRVGQSLARKSERPQLEWSFKVIDDAIRVAIGRSDLDDAGLGLNKRIRREVPSDRRERGDTPDQARNPHTMTSCHDPSSNLRTRELDPPALRAAYRDLIRDPSTRSAHLDNVHPREQPQALVPCGRAPPPARFGPGKRR